MLAPYAEGEISPADLRADIDAAMGTFSHTARTPLVQIGPRDFILELFHGPTLAFKDVAMQTLAKLMDRILAGARPPRDHRHRHLGRHGRRRRQRVRAAARRSTSSSSTPTGGCPTSSAGR